MTNTKTKTGARVIPFRVLKSLQVVVQNVNLSALGRFAVLQKSQPPTLNEIEEMKRLNELLYHLGIVDRWANGLRDEF